MTTEIMSEDPTERLKVTIEPSDKCTTMVEIVGRYQLFNLKLVQSIPQALRLLFLINFLINSQESYHT